MSDGENIKVGNSNVVGMDLGTTYSAIANVKNGRPEIIFNEDGDRTTPSVVYIPSDGQEPVLVGVNAERQEPIFPERVIRMVKRKMGTGEKIEINGKYFTPELISSHIISSLVRSAEKRMGNKIKAMVITVPAYFGDIERKATENAVKIAGYEPLKIINEPTAAALAYGFDKEADQTILVYDLGGGTFDVSILKISSGLFEVLSTAGDRMLGGYEFDEVIVNYLLSNFEKKNGIKLESFGNDQDRRISMQRIREEAKSAKHRLSHEIRTSINIPFICHSTDSTGKMIPLHLVDEITLSIFREKTKELMLKTKEKVYDALKTAKLKKEDISKILLVGGSTRMPMVEELISDIFGKSKINRSVNPDEVVAEGAAIQASIMTGDVKDILLLDTTPLSLGIETEGGMFQTIISRNTTIPVSKKERFSTAVDNQDTVTIKVYEGGRAKSFDNKLLGEFNLTGIEKAARGFPKIDVEFHVDSSGKLSVSARDAKTGASHSIDIESINLSDEEIEKMKKDIELNKEVDEKLKKDSELLNTANSYLYSFEEQEKKFKESGISPEDENYKRFLELNNKLRKAVEEKDYISLKEQIDNISEMMKVANQLSEESKKKEGNSGSNSEDNEKKGEEEGAFDYPKDDESN